MKRLLVSLVIASLMLVAGAEAAAAAADVFDGSSERIPAQLRRRMKGVSWRGGCPVPIRKLRLLRLDFVNFDGEERRGRLVVHRSEDDEILQVFEVLFDNDFPMKRLEISDAYAANDKKLMRKNITSAFNCRFVRGTNTWSQHAFGLAIDISPVQNPFVDGNRVVPRKGRRYRDRSQDKPGMIHGGDFVVDAFNDVGWEWGGNWNQYKDYMHFSKNGQ
ncbi:MAG: M15 family metallopeptidase [Actinomycetota bacterium]